MFGRKVFGKKAEVAPQLSEPRPSESHPGHHAVLSHLDREALANPMQRAQLAGRIVFDLAVQLVSDDKGARIEDVIAILATCGGYACAFAGLEAATALGERKQEHDLVIVSDRVGFQYVLGDLPNRYLLESEHALLSLVMGAAQQMGATVTMADAHDVMRHVSSTIGHDSFAIPRLPAVHQPRVEPIRLLLATWFKMSDAMELYQVPIDQQPAAFGFAVQRAMDAGQAVLSPRLAMEIAIECAVPVAKIMPGQFEQWTKRLDDRDGG